MSSKEMIKAVVEGKDPKDVIEQGLGLRQQAPDGGMGRMGGPVAGGPGGECVCPSCGATTPHETGSPCSDMTCSQCGAQFVREGKTPAEALDAGQAVVNEAFRDKDGSPEEKKLRRLAWELKEAAKNLTEYVSKFIKATEGERVSKEASTILKQANGVITKAERIV